MSKHNGNKTNENNEFKEREKIRGNASNNNMSEIILSVCVCVAYVFI